MKLQCDRGGNGDRLLVLLHGLGATRDVWRPMLETARWGGSWIAPDLRGHGASPHAGNYSLGCHATDVADLIAGPWREIVVIGHSMGGAVGLALASGWFSIVPVRVHGLGIKVRWSTDELSGLEKMAATPPRLFASKDEAMARFAKVSGLGPRATERGIAQAEGGWRLAADPPTARVGPPPMRALMSSAVCPIHMARGGGDAMVSHSQLAEFDPTTIDIAGAGHNAMIDAPGAVWDWLLGA